MPGPLLTLMNCISNINIFCLEIDQNTLYFSGRKILVATGGTKDARILDLSTTPPQTCTMKDYPMHVYGATGAVINGSPLICGGDGKIVCFQYNKSSHEWTYLAKMNTPRVGSASSPVNNTRLFITGGRTSRWDIHDIDTTEFVHSNGTVTAGPPLPRARSDHCMVTLTTGEIMILGGFPSSFDTYDDGNVIIFNPETNKYNTSVPSSKWGGGACALIKKSPMHDNRPIVLSTGGKIVHAVNDSDLYGPWELPAEIYDYTKANATWEESKYRVSFSFLLL